MQTKPGSSQIRNGTVIPTFIPHSISGNTYQAYFLLLAFTYIIIGFVTKGMFAVFAGHTKSALHSSKAIAVNYISSLLLFALGIYLVVISMSDILS